MVVKALVFTLACVGQMAHCWDQGLRDYILNIHNEMRKRPRACEMNKLEYDMDLERQAERWAKRCVFRHEIIPGRSENLAFDSHKYDDKKLIDTATDTWYNEIRSYRYGQYSCSNACHYTTLVWSKINRVGCYAHRCSYLSYRFRDAFYLVCFYTPQGNWNGELPYKTSCPVKCANGQIVEDGLCVGNRRQQEEGHGGFRAECKDTNYKCANWASRGQCQKNPSYMKSKCQKSCNACSGGS